MTTIIHEDLRFALHVPLLWILAYTVVYATPALERHWSSGIRDLSGPRPRRRRILLLECSGSDPFLLIRSNEKQADRQAVTGKRGLGSSSGKSRGPPVITRLSLVDSMCYLEAIGGWRFFKSFS